MSELASVASGAPKVTHVIARQVIVDFKRKVFGYELFDRSVAHHLHTAASDAELLFNALSHSEYQEMLTLKPLFVNCTHESLAGGHLELINPERVVLEIPALNGDHIEDIEDRRHVLEDLRGRGFRLAFKHGVLGAPYVSWLSLASFIKIDMTMVKPGELVQLIAATADRSRAQLIAEKVEGAEQFQSLLDAGVKLFQGYWFEKPVEMKMQIIRPSQANIIQLINLVRQQASTAEIEDVLKKDPTMSFNLLRFINSSGFGLSREITSFRHAVMILGLKKLFRWAVLLMTTSPSDVTGPVVANAAVVRGRLMELLASELLPPDECDNAFVTGVFSLLDQMLGIPLDEALKSISLPEVVVEALVHRAGKLAPFLELTEACESANDEAFAKAANALLLSNQQVNWAHLQALAWTDAMTA